MYVQSGTEEENYFARCALMRLCVLLLLPFFLADGLPAL